MWISYFPLFLLHFTTFLVAPLVALPEKFFDSKSLYRELHKLDQDDRWERFTSLHSGQHYFDLPVAGSHDDCDFDKKDGHERGCENWIFTISRHEKHPEMFSTLPTVLLMAGIEGDDAMGTTALVETARLLLKAISCSDGLIYEDQEHNCPSHKHPEAMQTILWLANLVSTRRIIIIPAVNSLGLYKKTLSEDGKHPETDFPSKGTDGCFETISARTINGLFRKDVIQLSLSFRTLEKSDDIHNGHGFPRLASTNDNLESGDKAGWDALVQGLQLYGKNNHDIHIDYSSKPLGHYYDKRGMEYWSYRGSTDDLSLCDNGKDYSVSQSVYNDAMLRNIGFVLETPYDRVGSEIEGHKKEQLIRSIRYALMTIELVQPYLTIVNVGNDWTETKPFHKRSTKDDDDDDEKCMTRHDTHNQFHAGKDDKVQWKVGGSFSVDSTQIVYGYINDFPDSFGCGDSEQPTPEDARMLDYLISKGVLHESKTKTGIEDMTAFSAFTEAPEFYNISPPASAIFTDKLDLSHWKDGTKIAILARGTVDQNWIETSKKGTYAAQSHLVNERTNDNWKKRNTKTAEVQGSTTWFSEPVVVLVRHDDSKYYHSNDNSISQDYEEFENMNADEWHDSPYKEWQAFEGDVEIVDDDVEKHGIIFFAAIGAGFFFLYRYMSQGQRNNYSYAQPSSSGGGGGGGGGYQQGGGGGGFYG